MLNKVLIKLLIAPIKVYQIALSPFLGQNCRHIPSCSNYTIQALEQWGAVKGSWLATKRIFRCNPWWWGTQGEDPLPKKKNN